MNGTISKKLLFAGIALLVAAGGCAPAERIDEEAQAAMARRGRDFRGGKNRAGSPCFGPSANG